MAAAAVLAMALWMPARADDAEAAFRACQAAERALDYAEAATACATCFDLDPTGPRATRCAGRADWIEARRDPDGGFAALTALQEVRRDYRSLGADAARSRVHDLWASTRAGIVHAEAALWLARHDLQAGDAEAALGYTTPLWGQEWPPEVAKPLTELHTTALARAGRIDEARAAEGPSTGPRASAADVAVRERRRDALSATSGVGVALFAAAGLPLAVRGWRRGAAGRVVPFGLVLLLVAFVGAGLLAESWEAGAGRSLPWLAAVAVAVHAVALGAQLGVGGRWRAAVGALAAWATVGGSFLVLRATGSLDWIGL